jgi:hypothetical protein
MARSESHRQSSSAQVPTEMVAFKPNVHGFRVRQEGHFVTSSSKTLRDLCLRFTAQLRSYHATRYRSTTPCLDISNHGTFNIHASQRMLFWQTGTDDLINMLWAPAPALLLVHSFLARSSESHDGLCSKRGKLIHIAASH